MNRFLDDLFLLDILVNRKKYIEYYIVVEVFIFLVYVYLFICYYCLIYII